LEQLFVNGVLFGSYYGIRPFLAIYEVYVFKCELDAP